MCPSTRPALSILYFTFQHKEQRLEYKWSHFEIVWRLFKQRIISDTSHRNDLETHSANGPVSLSTRDCQRASLSSYIGGGYFLNKRDPLSAFVYIYACVFFIIIRTFVNMLRIYVSPVWYSWNLADWMEEIFQECMSDWAFLSCCLYFINFIIVIHSVCRENTREQYYPGFKEYSIQEILSF